MEITEEMLYKCAPEAEKLWLNSLPPDNQIPEHKFSRNFERKMRKLIREQKQSTMSKKIRSAVKRIAIVVLIIVIPSFSGLMTVKAYRAKFIEVITEVFYDLTHFNFFSSWSGDTELGEIELNYLPDGMVEIYRETLAELQSQEICFENAEGRCVQVSQQLVSDSIGYDVILDTEDAAVTTITLGDYEASLIVKEDISTLMWEYDHCIILLTGDFPPEEIIKIANGMTISK